MNEEIQDAIAKLIEGAPQAWAALVAENAAGRGVVAAVSLIVIVVTLVTARAAWKRISLLECTEDDMASAHLAVIAITAVVVLVALVTGTTAAADCVAPGVDLLERLRG